MFPMMYGCLLLAWV